MTTKRANDLLGGKYSDTQIRSILDSLNLLIELGYQKFELDHTICDNEFSSDLLQHDKKGIRISSSIY